MAVTLAHASEEIVVGEDGIPRINGVGPYVKVSFVLVASTKSYSDALEAAQRAIGLHKRCLLANLPNR